MCGIVAYKGRRNGVPLVRESLCLLSYRGYDSWGVGVWKDDRVVVHRSVGDVTKAAPLDLQSSCVIGHTRWATHGSVSVSNAHPHTSSDGSIAVVHNGIIENFREVKCDLESKGFVFVSETDTEIIPHLIES